MIHNCYTCKLPDFHASCPATRTEPAVPAYFECELHGCTGADEVDGEFQCPDWLRNGHDLYDELAQQTSPDHARRRQPAMVEAGITSCGLALVI